VVAEIHSSYSWFKECLEVNPDPVGVSLSLFKSACSAVMIMSISSFSLYKNMVQG